VPVWIHVSRRHRFLFAATASTGEYETPASHPGPLDGSMWINIPAGFMIFRASAILKYSTRPAARATIL